MKHVYIVEGNTGEYSDRCNWIVMAFLSKKRADDLRNKLTEEAKRLGVSQGMSADWEARQKATEEMKKLDPQFECDYTGTDYCLYRVDLDEGGA